MKKPLLALILSFLLFLTACSTEAGGLFKEGIGEFINNEYVIYDTVNDTTDNSNYSEVYFAEKLTIPEVVAQVTSHEQPIEISELIEGKQALIYDNLFVIITEDPENPANTFIELANYDFVRNNYSPSFFDGLFLLWVLDDVLDVDDWGKKRNSQCKMNQDNCYDGYGYSGGSFKGINKKPTVRGGSSSVRGGGPGAGK
ncbi:DUF4247 domain-containing protein [Bacillus sp. PS06]|uniref:DUF4247 domain-containing protein n=1 Tax=Bacillus sp. PS06 TaxID=2764176 RepID=UPI00177E61C9|nr:DUF4247 domain-containing protein [Bacillus sp. PS06]MBD8067368.1 DUF4247 domain-containing protein [Bacillus sp. PS06]